jgi:integrase/recombinase XerD
MNITNISIEKFKSYLEVKGKSKNTIKHYTYDANVFLNFINPNNINNNINRENIVEYKSHLQSKQLNAKTINGILSSLKSYNEFLISIGIQESIVILSQDYIKIQKSFTSPTNTNNNEVGKFIKKIESEPYRNYAIVVALANTGLRISELLNLKLSDLKNLDKNEATIIGKGNKQRKIIVYPRAVEVIKEYIKNHRFGKYENSPYVFISNKAEKLHTATIQAIFNKYSSKITPHDLRHNFATYYLKETNDLIGLQEQLGHENLNTTRIYLHPSMEDRKSNMKSFSIG